MKSRQEGRRSRLGLRIVSILLIGIVLGGAGAFVLHRYMGSKTAYTSQVTEFNLRDIGELATQEGCYTAIQTITSSRREFGITFPFTTKNYIYSMDGVVKAGLDFSLIALNEDSASKTLTVSMPPAKLLSVVPDRDSFKVYYEGKNMFNDLHLEETNEAEKAAEAEIKEKAIAYGILEHAQDNAEILVRAMLEPVYPAGEWTIRFDIQEAS